MAASFGIRNTLPAMAAGMASVLVMNGKRIRDVI
jgi:hypothetical protein